MRDECALIGANATAASSPELHLGREAPLAVADLHLLPLPGMCCRRSSGYPRTIGRTAGPSPRRSKRVRHCITILRRDGGHADGLRLHGRSWVHCSRRASDGVCLRSPTTTLQRWWPLPRAADASRPTITWFRLYVWNCGLQSAPKSHAAPFSRDQAPDYLGYDSAAWPSLMHRCRVRRRGEDFAAGGAADEKPVHATTASRTRAGPRTDHRDDQRSPPPERDLNIAACIT